MYTRTRSVLRSSTVQLQRSVYGRRGIMLSLPARNSSETTLLRSTELGAVEETQDIATMDHLLRTLRGWLLSSTTFPCQLTCDLKGDRANPEHNS